MYGRSKLTARLRSPNDRSSPSYSEPRPSRCRPARSSRSGRRAAGRGRRRCGRSPARGGSPGRCRPAAGRHLRATPSCRWWWSSARAPRRCVPRAGPRRRGSDRRPPRPSAAGPRWHDPATPRARLPRRTSRCAGPRSSPARGRRRRDPRSGRGAPTRDRRRPAGRGRHRAPGRRRRPECPDAGSPPPRPAAPCATPGCRCVRERHRRQLHRAVRDPSGRCSRAPPRAHRPAPRRAQRHGATPARNPLESIRTLTNGHARVVL